MIIPRELGEIPISIPTASAVENLFSEDPEREFTYTNQSMWINIRTLIRNLISSIKPEDDYDDESVILDLLEEIKILLTILSENNIEGKNKVTLYFNSHNSLEKVYPNAKVKRPKTDKQISYFRMEQRIIKPLLDNLKSKEDYTLKKGDYKLNGDDSEAIVLTHHPLDLLSRYQFSELYLLESHTGVIKRQSQWNTKLTGGKNHPRIPFNSLTLQVFGDQSTSFYSYSAAYKKAITDLAKTANWNASTSGDKIKSDLFRIKVTNPVIYELFAKLITAKMFF